MALTLKWASNKPGVMFAAKYQGAGAQQFTLRGGFNAKAKKIPCTTFCGRHAPFCRQCAPAQAGDATLQKLFQNSRDIDRIFRERVCSAPTKMRADTGTDQSRGKAERKCRSAAEARTPGKEDCADHLERNCQLHAGPCSGDIEGCPDRFMKNKGSSEGTLPHAPFPTQGSNASSVEVKSPMILQLSTFDQCSPENFGQNNNRCHSVDGLNNYNRNHHSDWGEMILRIPDTDSESEVEEESTMQDALQHIMNSKSPNSLANDDSCYSIRNTESFRKELKRFDEIIKPVGMSRSRRKHDTSRSQVQTARSSSPVAPFNSPFASMCSSRRSSRQSSRQSSAKMAWTDTPHTLAPVKPAVSKARKVLAHIPQPSVESRFIQTHGVERHDEYTSEGAAENKTPKTPENSSGVSSNSSDSSHSLSVVPESPASKKAVPWGGFLKKVLENIPEYPEEVDWSISSWKKYAAELEARSRIKCCGRGFKSGWPAFQEEGWFLKSLNVLSTHRNLSERRRQMMLQANSSDNASTPTKDTDVILSHDKEFLLKHLNRPTASSKSRQVQQAPAGDKASLKGARKAKDKGMTCSFNPLQPTNRFKGKSFLNAQEQRQSVDRLSSYDPWPSLVSSQ